MKTSLNLDKIEQILVAIVSTISFIGCLFVFTTWQNISVPNYVTRRIISSIGLAGLLTSFGFFLSVFVDGYADHYLKHEGLCYLQGYIIQYFYLASSLWTVCFAFHLYQLIVKQNEYPEKLLWLYRTIGWGYPGVVVIFLLLRQLTGHLGIGGADRRWCWISTHESTAHAIVLSHWKMEGALHQLLLFYVPLGFVLVFNIIIYGRILRFLRADPMVYRIRLRIYLYLGIFIGCYSWGIINRLIQFFNKPYHVPNKYLTLMECICDPLQPLLSTIVYGFNKRSIEGYKQKFCSRWFYAQLSSSSEGEEDEDSSTQVVSHQERFLSQVGVQNLVTPQGPLSPSSSTHFSPMLFPQRLLIGERGRDRGQRYKQQQRQQQQQKEDSKKIPFLP